MPKMTVAQGRQEELSNGLHPSLSMKSFMRERGFEKME